MSNTISVNGMTSYYNSFISTVTKQRAGVSGTKGEQNSISGSRDSFVSTLSSKAETAAMNRSEAVEESKAVSTNDMTLEEYKNYINDVISSFTWHSDNSGDYCSIDISDEGFKAMQADPEYEKWVFDDLKTAFATPMPGWARSIGGTKYQVVHYGATKEECHSTSWWTGYQKGTGDKVWEAQSKGSFWTKRGDQKRIQAQTDKKIAEKRALEKKWMQEAADKRRAYTDFLNGNNTVKANSLSEISDMFSMPVNAKVSELMASYEAGTFAGNVTI